MDKERMQKEGWVKGRLPWVEGKCIPESILDIDSETGQWEHYSRYPEPDPDWKDPKIYETDTYYQDHEEMLYDHLIRCKKCGTHFIAYDAEANKVKNYCPGCGTKLTKGE